MPTEGESFQAFCYRQRQRVLGKWGVVEKRVQRARRDRQRHAGLAWETRGRIAGLCGVRQRAQD